MSDLNRYIQQLITWLLDTPVKPETLVKRSHIWSAIMSSFRLAEFSDITIEFSDDHLLELMDKESITETQILKLFRHIKSPTSAMYDICMKLKYASDIPYPFRLNAHQLCDRYLFIGTFEDWLELRQLQDEVLSAVSFTQPDILGISRAKIEKEVLIEKEEQFRKILSIPIFPY